MAEGPIMLNARAQIPQTWDALARASIFGSELLTLTSDAVKYRLWSTVAEPADEYAFYGPLGCMMAGKWIAIQVIPAGADYWSDQLTSETTSGTNETISYPDRINSLWRIHARLLQEMKELSPQFDAIFGRTAIRRISMPTVSDWGIPLVTANPYSTTPPINPTTYPKGILPWYPWDEVGLMTTGMS
jgi:hypothetical protein